MPKLGLFWGGPAWLGKGSAPSLPLETHRPRQTDLRGDGGSEFYRFGPEFAVDLQRAYQAAISNHSNGDCR